MREVDVIAIDGDTLTYTVDRVWFSTATRTRSDLLDWELIDDPAPVKIKRGARVAIATWGDEEVTGTVTRVERNVYGTEPGYAVKFDDGAHLVVGADRIRVIEATA